MEVSVVSDFTQQFLAHITSNFFWSWVGSREQTRTEIRRMHWRAPKQVPNLSSHLRNGTSLDFADECANYLHVFICVTCRGMAWTFTVFNHVWITSASQKTAFSSWHCHLKPFCYLHVFPIFFPSQKQILRRMRRSSQSATGKSHIAINTHKNKHPLRSNTESYGCKTP